MYKKMRGNVIFGFLLVVHATAGLSLMKTRSSRKLTEHNSANNTRDHEERCIFNKISTRPKASNNLYFRQSYRCFPSYDSPIRFAMDRTATMALVWRLRNVLWPTEEQHLELVLPDSACVVQVSWFNSNKRIISPVLLFSRRFDLRTDNYT